jgi:hypothetical protein
VAHRGRRNADDALVAALAGGATVRAASRRANLSERTAHRRLEDADFRRRVREARTAMIRRASGRMAAGMAGAAATLRRLLDARADTVKLAAARAILELGVKLGEVAALEERLAELERQLGGRADAGATDRNGESPVGPAAERG